MGKTDKYYKNENLHMEFYEGAARMISLRSRMNKTLTKVVINDTATLKPAVVREVKDELEEAEFLLKFCAEDWKDYWALESVESESENLRMAVAIYRQD